MFVTLFSVAVFCTVTLFCNVVWPWGGDFGLMGRATGIVVRLPGSWGGDRWRLRSSGARRSPAPRAQTDAPVSAGSGN